MLRHEQSFCGFDTTSKFIQTNLALDPFFVSNLILIWILVVLKQEYMREVGLYLVDAKDEEKMCELSLDGVRLLCCVCVVNPAALLAGMQGLIDPALAEARPIDTAYYNECLVSPSCTCICNTVLTCL